MPPRPWANKPWELLKLPPKPIGTTPSVALKIATEMAQVHNAILRGLNTIYLQAPNLQTPTEKSNLLFLTKSWAKWVTDHHRLEEKMFPGFEKALGIPGLMRRDVEQYHAFEGELERLLRYASDTKAEEFEGSRLRGLLEGLVEGGFRVHLEGEIETLLSLGEFTSSEKNGVEKGKALLKVYKECENEAAGQDKWIIPSMVLGLRDITYEGSENWPVVPTAMLWVVHHLLARRNAGAWSLLPCDTWGRPRELPFA